MFLTEKKIIQLLQNHAAKRAPVEWDSAFRMAAVLTPLLIENGKCHLLFTRRTEMVNSHKGQVSFPGGLIEPQDNGPIATALRETYEEIGIPPEKIKILGQLDDVYTASTGFVITPIVGRIPWPVQLKISADEVSRVFTIPLSWLANPDHLEERSMILPDGRVIPDVLYYKPYNGEEVWGITARITLKLLQVLELA
ncbi:MAG: CoA pyrophosphatase [Anaerolineae bacterium]|nr:CoA pyrophosphatase [Anaerolineae bacterium]